MSVLDSKVLVLNKSYMPLRTTTVMDAICKLWSETAEAITVENGAYMSYDFNSWAEISAFQKEFEDELSDGKVVDWIRTPSFALMVPRVVRLLTYDKSPRFHMRLTRKNIYDRDNHKCQYCGKKFPTDELNIDHVIPRSRGGKNTWDNLVCSCIKCNRKKKNNTPKEAGMKLLSKPKKPSPTFSFKMSPTSERYEDWDAFVSDQYWNVSIKD